MQSRPALAEKRPDALLVTKGTEEIREIDSAVWSALDHDQRLVEPGVALRPHRAGADHHRVEAGAQPGQHRRVGGRADRSRDAADRSPPVDRGGEVRRQIRPVLARVLPRAVGIELLLDRDRAGIWKQAPHLRQRSPVPTGHRTGET